MSNSELRYICDKIFYIAQLWCPQSKHSSRHNSLHYIKLQKFEQELSNLKPSTSLFYSQIKQGRWILLLVSICQWNSQLFSRISLEPHPEEPNT